MCAVALLCDLSELASKKMCVLLSSSRWLAVHCHVPCFLSPGHQSVWRAPGSAGTVQIRVMCRWDCFRVMCGVSDSRMGHNSSWVFRSSGIWHCVLKKWSVSIFSGQQILPILLWPLDTEDEGTTFLKTVGIIHPMVQHYVSRPESLEVVLWEP
jgi:hypothetical protein